MAKKFKKLRPPKPPDRIQNIKTIKPIGAQKYIKAHWRWDGKQWIWIKGHWSR